MGGYLFLKEDQWRIFPKRGKIGEQQTKAIERRDKMVTVVVSKDGVQNCKDYSSFDAAEEYLEKIVDMDDPSTMKAALFIGRRGEFVTIVGS